jgi:hypothetical protein
MLNGQDFNSLLKKATDTYVNSNSYSIGAVYNMYPDSISSIKIDQQKATFYKNENDYYLKMADAEIIVTDSFFIKISHSEKMMLYSKMNTSKKERYTSQLPFYNLESQFKTKTVNDKGKYWEFVMTGSLSISIPYNKIILHVSKDDYVIKKQVYVFNRSLEKQFNPESKNTGERLEIITTKFSVSPKDLGDKLNLEKYLTITDNTLTSSNYTKNYKIIVQ